MAQASASSRRRGAPTGESGQIVVHKESSVGGISDRAQEIKRRRSRRKKYLKFRQKLKKANASEKTVIVHKVRNMTPGCETVIANLGLEEIVR